MKRLIVILAALFITTAALAQDKPADEYNTIARAQEQSLRGP